MIFDGFSTRKFDNVAYALDTEGASGQAYRLYKSAFNRTPDASGSQYWVDNLQHGQSRADLLFYFSEGKENHEAVAKLIGDGFSYTPYGG